MMKKILLSLSAFLLLMSSLLVACSSDSNTSELYRIYQHAPSITIEETYWYLDTGDNGLPWYCLYIKAKNDGNKSIKEVKWYLEYRTSGFKGNEESFSPHYLDYVQLEWSLDGNWQAGERKIFRKHIQCVEDKGSDGLKYAIHTMQNGRITPYWINYTGFGGSWGEKNFDKLIPSYSDPHNGGMIIINYGPHTRYAVQIPKFTVLGSSE